MGELLNYNIASITKSKLIKEVRGRGLFRAIEINHEANVQGKDL